MMAFIIFIRYLCFVLILLLPHAVLGANILISSIYGEGSHFMVGAAIGHALLDRGHNVTCLISRAYEPRTTNPKYSDLSFEVFDHRGRTVQEVHDFFYQFSMLAFDGAESQLFSMMEMMTQTMADDCEGVLMDDALMRRLAHIDVIIMDPTWLCGISIKAMIEHKSNYTKNIQMISVIPYVPESILLWLYGSSYNPAYQPEISTGYTNRMTLLQRAVNVFYSGLGLLMTHWTLSPFGRATANVGLDPSVMDMWKIHEYFDLHLMNVAFSTEFPIPRSPNMILIGGGITSTPPAPLDDELEAYMNSSGDDGVIVFTLGTYFASVAKFKPEFAAMFFEAFRRFPQKVIWQLKDLPEQEVPPNVKTMPWVPQNDLLGHAKTRVFMSHGGNNGFQEASYHGVPMVVIPFIADQYDVGARVAARGMGRRMDKATLTADVIYETLNDVINNPKYAAVAKEVAAINRNQPMSPRERAAFWVEHVIQFGGDYLRPPAGELNFIQYYMLDVMALLSTIVVVVALIVFYVVRFCISLCCSAALGSNKPKQE